MSQLNLPEYPSLLFEALRAQNAPVTYTRYRDAGHVAIWEQAYGSSLLFDWLLQHSR